MVEAAITDLAAQEIAARIDRLPPSRHLLRLVLRIAVGNWFEAYELFMPGFISIGLIGDGVYTVTTKGLLDFHSFPSFLASFFAGMFLSTLVFGWLSDHFRAPRDLRLVDVHLLGIQSADCAQLHAGHDRFVALSCRPRGRRSTHQQ